LLAAAAATAAAAAANRHGGIVVSIVMGLALRHCRKMFPCSNTSVFFPERSESTWSIR